MTQSQLLGMHPEIILNMGPQGLQMRMFVVEFFVTSGDLEVGWVYINWKDINNME